MIFLMSSFRTELTYKNKRMTEDCTILSIGLEDQCEDGKVTKGTVGTGRLLQVMAGLMVCSTKSFVSLVREEGLVS